MPSPASNIACFFPRSLCLCPFGSATTPHKWSEYKSPAAASETHSLSVHFTLVTRTHCHTCALSFCANFPSSCFPFIFSLLFPTGTSSPCRHIEQFKGCSMASSFLPLLCSGGLRWTPLSVVLLSVLLKFKMDAFWSSVMNIFPNILCLNC